MTSNAVRKAAEMPQAWLGPIDGYLRWQTRRGRSLSTLVHLRRWLYEYADTIGQPSPDTVTVRDVTAWLAEVAMSVRSGPRALESAHGALRGFYRYAAHQGLVPADLAATVIPVPYQRPSDAPKVTPETAVSRHLDWLRIRNMRRWTIYNRQCALARAAHWAGGPILKLTEDELKRWQQSRSTELQPEPLRTEMSHLRAFYSWALDERLIRVDPMRRLPLPKVHRGLPRPISDDLLAQAITAATPETAAILALAAFAGLRAHEVAQLTWNDVVLGAEPHIRIEDGKGGVGRVVPLSGPLTEKIQALPERRGPVIRRMDGLPGPVGAHRISQRANDHLHELGIEASLHQCRHRFATVTYQSCRDIRAVQDLLGHASPVTTSRYAASSSTVARAAVEAAGMMGGQS